MSLSPVELASYVAAGALAASKLFSATKALWDKLPRSVAVALPVLVAALPQVASAAGLVKTDADFATFVVTAVALVLPGLAEAEKSA